MIGERRAEIAKDQFKRNWRVINPSDNVQCLHFKQEVLDSYRTDKITDNQLAELLLRVTVHTSGCEYCKNRWLPVMNQKSEKLAVQLCRYLQSKPCLQWNPADMPLMIGGLLSKPEFDAKDFHIQQCADCLARWVAELLKNPCSMWESFIKPAFFTAELSAEAGNKAIKHTDECYCCNVLTYNEQLKSGRVIVDQFGNPIVNPDTATMRNYRLVSEAESTSTRETAPTQSKQADDLTIPPSQCASDLQSQPQLQDNQTASHPAAATARFTNRWQVGTDARWPIAIAASVIVCLTLTAMVICHYIPESQLLLTTHPRYSRITSALKLILPCWLSNSSKLIHASKRILKTLMRYSIALRWLSDLVCSMSR